MALWPLNVGYKIFDKSFAHSTHYYKRNDFVLEDEIHNNINAIKSYLGLSKLVLLNQTHSNNIIHVKSLNKDYTKSSADGCFSVNSKIALGITTADCIPIVITDIYGSIIAALHVGYRGALNGIIFNFHKKLTQNGLLQNQLLAVIGPCISQKFYEVSQDIFEAFSLVNNFYSSFFLESSTHKDKYFFDLQGLVLWQLNQINVISQINKVDTYEDSASFSYRRATHLGFVEYRRLLTVVFFKSCS